MRTWLPPATSLSAARLPDSHWRTSCSERRADLRRRNQTRTTCGKSISGFTWERQNIVARINGDRVRLSEWAVSPVDLDRTALGRKYDNKQSCFRRSVVNAWCGI